MTINLYNSKDKIGIFWSAHVKSAILTTATDRSGQNQANEVLDIDKTPS